MPRDEELAMMRGARPWPHHHLLCLRNGARCGPDGLPALGLLVWSQGPRVWLGSIYEEPRESVAYESFDALYDAGWRVD